MFRVTRPAGVPGRSSAAPPSALVSCLSPEQVESFGSQVPLSRPGQPAEVAPVHVLLASDEGPYVSGARIAVTGGRPIL